ncbi:MAG: CHAT domain-containing protein [Gemmatimonadota bacterium]
MRKFSQLVGATLLPIGMAAQPSAGRTLDSLPPRMLPVLALRAKTTDRVQATQAEWRAWAAAAPSSPAPRLGLAQLARFDVRYADGQAWVDSAARVATTPVWRSAVARERIAIRLTRGEFTGVDTLVRALVADTAGLPVAEVAEVLYLQAGHQRRVTRRIPPGALDAVLALTAPGDTSMQARVGCLRAATEPARMLEYAEPAISLAKAYGLPSIAANCELGVATNYIGAGDMPSGVRWLRRSEATARDAHDDPTLAAALQWHGYSQRTLGYVQEARRWYTDAIRVSQRIGDRNVEAWALLGVAASARDVGDASTASTALARAATLFEATGDYIGSMNAQLERAQSRIRVRDLAGADSMVQRIRSLADSLNYTSARLRSVYLLADIALRRNQLDECSRLLDAAAPIIEQLGAPWRAQLQEYRGMLAQRRGDSQRAIALLTDVRTRYVNAQDLYLHNIDGSLALAWLNSGDSARAAALIDESSRRLDAVRDTLALSGLRRVVGSPDYWGATNGNVDQAMAAFVQSPRWLPTVFRVTERSRARALISGTLANESDTSLADITAARRRVRASATVLADVQKALKPNTALLVYAGGRSGARTSLMLITRTAARGFTLATLDSLDRDIVRWLALLESGEPGVGAGRRVATSVLASALRSLPNSIRRLVIVPHGPLYRVPFQALPFGNGVLGDRAVVTISPSVSMALTYAAEPRQVPGRVLAMGAGDTEVANALPQSLDLMLERSDRGNPLAPLPAAGDEARAAAAWGVGSMALTGPAASETALKREARGAYSVLHAAAHALTSDQALGANYLILRPDAADDGYVSGGELATLSAGMSMVVLSGCRTTGDFGSHGDAVDGLVAPLLARGVRTVVASHWAVSDRWTRVLMERFYERLSAGASTADAMNGAQTSLRRAGVPARFWAAFSVIGDGALTFTPTTMSRSR